MPTFNYKLDDEDQSTGEHVLTPNQILLNAGLDVHTHYLVQIIGKKRESYEGKAAEEIHMHNHMIFVSVSTGATPVSF